MSVQATAWVLSKGPKMTDVDRAGKKYGTRARGLRAVLFTIADAANRDGENSHPGVKAIVEGALYSKSQSLAIIDELVAEGWLKVTEKGVGRGKATVYTVLLDRRESVRPSDRSTDGGSVRPSDASDASNSPVTGHIDEGKGPVSEEKRSDPDDEKVRSEGDAHISQPKTSTTTQPSGAEAPAARPPRPTDDPVKARAHQLAVFAFEQEVKPELRTDAKAGAFPAVMALFERLLRSGVIVGDIERAIRVGIGVWTLHGIQTSIARNKPNSYGGRDASYDAARAARERAAAEDAEAAKAAS